ncbi:hypothetical protein, partial [Pantoea ananatis]|uniref:hypothetical protein n=1 Tax=Pantoea ananas TaxID=553 RepID=UPI003D09FD77
MKSADEKMQKSKAGFIADYQALNELIKTDPTAEGVSAMKKLTEAKDRFFRVFEHARQLGL